MRYMTFLLSNYTLVFFGNPNLSLLCGLSDTKCLKFAIIIMLIIEFNFYCFRQLFVTVRTIMLHLLTIWREILNKRISQVSTQNIVTQRIDFCPVNQRKVKLNAKHYPSLVTTVVKSPQDDYFWYHNCLTMLRDSSF